MQPPKQSIYIFDADGVLNDLQDYLPDERIIIQIAKLLDNGIYAAINTGRGYVWVEEKIVRRVRQKLQDASSLDRFFISVEMGGLGVEFVHGKERQNHSAFSLREQQIAEVQRIFQGHPEYQDKMHWYEGKATMATLYKDDDFPMDAFQPIKNEMTEILESAFKGEHVAVTNTADSIDIHAPEAGKWAGAQLIYDWLRRTSDVQHDHFVCFGDSVGDYKMALFFAEQSHDTIFVFTGQNFDEAEPHPALKVVKTEQLYKEGTYSYLRDARRD